jgi:hypothetical protein
VLPTDHFDKSQGAYGHKYFFYLKEAIGKETSLDDDRPKLVDEYLVIFPELIRVAK